MTFRADLQAANDRCHAVESELAEAKSAAKKQQDIFERKIQDLSAALQEARKGASSHPKAVAWIPAGFVALLYLLSIALATSDEDAAAWQATHLCVFASLIGTAWSLGRSRLLWPWLAGLVIKAGVLVAWGNGWWAFEYAHINRSGSAALYFFWCAPLFLIAMTLLEGLLIRLALRPARHEPRT
jgi:hypothetical protein